MVAAPPSNGVAHDPADVRGGEADVVRAVDAEDVADGEVQAYGMAARVASHALRRPRRARCVHDVDGVATLDWDALHSFASGLSPHSCHDT